jgi:hypothetical protein
MLARGDFMRETAGSRDWSSVQVWGAKAFPDFPAAGGLQWLFPDVRFVYIFRNGIDAVFSMSKFPGFRDMSFAERCSFWAGNALRYEWLLRNDSAIAIRFEEFLNHPDAALRRVLSHTQLPYEEGPAQFARTTLVHPLDQPTAAANPSSVLSLRTPARQSWSSQEKQTFRDLCSEAMDLLGYDVESGKPRAPAHETGDARTRPAAFSGDLRR